MLVAECGVAEARQAIFLLAEWGRGRWHRCGAYKRGSRQQNKRITRVRGSHLFKRNKGELMRVK